MPEDRVGAGEAERVGNDKDREASGLLCLLLPQAERGGAKGSRTWPLGSDRPGVESQIFYNRSKL